jgi:DNA-directed RNA polymerase subunit RPC12/RpoP
MHYDCTTCTRNFDNPEFDVIRALLTSSQADKVEDILCTACVDDQIAEANYRDCTVCLASFAPSGGMQELCPNCTPA